MSRLIKNAKVSLITGFKELKGRIFNVCWLSVSRRISVIVISDSLASLSFPGQHLWSLLQILQSLSCFLLAHLFFKMANGCASCEGCCLEWTFELEGVFKICPFEVLLLRKTLGSPHLMSPVGKIPITLTLKLLPLLPRTGLLTLIRHPNGIL